MPLMFRIIITIVLAFASLTMAQPATTSATLPSTTQSRPMPKFGQALAIEPLGRSGRSGAVIDPIELGIVTGKWSAPSDGEVVAIENGPQRAWRKIDSNEGLFNDDALAGGWCYVPVESPDDRVAILGASSHTMVYVNGEPRAGDPYETGYVRLPVYLHKGTNDLLFACARGRLRVELTEPQANVYFDPADLTAPDAVRGVDETAPFGVVIVNATTQPVRRRVSEKTQQPVTIPPLSARKLAMPVHLESKESAGLATISLLLEGDQPSASVQVRYRVREPGESFKRTFVSNIDGSAQYFAIVPAQPQPRDEKLAMVLSLHGASVEAIGQAEAYASKPWCNIVCPTNRRPFGFDWEDWGRLDAMEVLEQAQTLLQTDPTRVYLTGHSMGGHGAWQVGSIFPDRFAAVGPSAGWLSFATYGRAPATNASSQPTARPATVADLFRRAALSSDTPQLMPNLASRGVYILHGIDDDNVPVAQARLAMKILDEFNRDHTIHEQPHASHWWDDSDEPGASCVDWPAMFDFFNRHRLPRNDEVLQIDFRTASPSISSRCHWATIDAQIRPMQLSRVTLRFDPHTHRITGTTENVARLILDVSQIKEGNSIQISLDGKSPGEIQLPASAVSGGAHLREIVLDREGDQWKSAAAPSPAMKSASSSGPFKNAFAHRMIFVYGTNGSVEENAATYAKARFDSETWWYRGNGAVDLIADRDFDSNTKDRNVILYGNADTNSAWKSLLADSPIQVGRGKLQVGEKSIAGDDLAALFLRPMANSSTALIGVVASTGVTGTRLTNRLNYFASGVGFPDWCVVDPQVISQGMRAARGAGFFANDWTISQPATAWRDTPSPATLPESR